MLEVIQGGETTWASVRDVWEYGKGLAEQQAIEDLATRRLAYPLKRVRLLAPIPSPARNVFCLGRNYADHAAERGAAAPDHPVYFTKPGTRSWGPATTSSPRHHQGAGLRSSSPSSARAAGTFRVPRPSATSSGTPSSTT
jgi:2-keto-4-pentenoate hydratase/2-oxohepta-3-ene-1,7-dioic acid hydratase in catechol pathway